MPTGFLITTLVFGLLLAAVSSLRLKNSNFSQFELERRAKKHDKSAIEALARQERLVELQTAQRLLQIILLVLIAMLLVGTAGIWWGGLWLFFNLILVLLLSKSSRMNSYLQRWYDRHETSVVHILEPLRPVLRMLAQPLSQPTIQLNSPEELVHLARSSNSVFTSKQLALLEHGLQFPTRLVSDIMTPGSVIEAAEDREVLGPVVLNRLHASGHSRFPVYKKDLDHIVGMLYLHDLVAAKLTHKTVADAMQKRVYYIRDDDSLEHALQAFLRTHHHLFIVINSYRETVGLLGLEDVIEALLGRQIIDEFDAHDDLRAVAEHNPRRNNTALKSTHI